jgi:hypothetical protein
MVEIAQDYHEERKNQCPKVLSSRDQRVATAKAPAAKNMESEKATCELARDLKTASI